jgi:hypothetical protein
MQKNFECSDDKGRIVGWYHRNDCRIFLAFCPLTEWERHTRSLSRLRRQFEERVLSVPQLRWDTYLAADGNQDARHRLANHRSALALDQLLRRVEREEGAPVARI